MADHSATAAARILRRQIDGLVEDGALIRAEAETLRRAVPLLEWLGEHADVLRDMARRVVSARRDMRLLTDDEISELAADPTVAAVIAAFPGATATSGPLPQRAYDGAADDNHESEDAA